MHTKPRVTLVTCKSIPELDAEDAPLVNALSDRGADARVAIWDDPEVDWSEAGLVVLRSPRDYANQREKFLTWARSVPRLLNPADVLDWNTDKHYLEDLRHRDVPVLATLWLEPDRGYGKRQLHTRFPSSAEFVLKPAVSGGAHHTGRYTANEADSRAHAIKHALRLLAEGRSVMVQRYQPSVDLLGERSLVFIDEEFVYAVHKAAMLHGPSLGPEDQHIERIDSITATDEELAVAEAVRDAVRAELTSRFGDIDAPLLFERIDLVTDETGSPAVMEVGLTDSSLHFSHHSGALEAFADAIARRL